MTQTSNAARRARLLTIPAGVLVLLVLAGVLVDRKTQPTLISGPMVQIPEPGTLMIVWSMDAPFARGAVRLIGKDGGERVAQAEAQPPRYEATFRGLPAGTEFNYTVINHGFIGREILLIKPLATATPAPRGRPFRFVAFGDSGVGSPAQTALVDRMADANPDLAIHTGDVIQATGAPEEYPLAFWLPNARLLRRIPFMPSLGNHDCLTEAGKPLLDTFVLPRNGPPGVEPERVYWFDFGDARFVALDSNRADAKHAGVLSVEQMKTLVAPWLRQVLTQCDARWKFVYFHHPIYTNSRHSEDKAAHMKEAFAQVFDECGVDVVFAGHNHLYERTAPMRGGRIVVAQPPSAVVEESAGVVYITTGAGGAARYPARQPVPDYIRAYNDELLSFTLVDVLADRLVVKQIGENGATIDESTIMIRGSGDQGTGGPGDQGMRVPLIP